MSSLDVSLREQVGRFLGDELLPLLGVEGGGVEVVEVAEGVARVRLLGSCAGCMGSVQGLLLGLEPELRRRVPGVDHVELVP
jgi:Fe-S cluster biogenesis protein NfuA